MKEIKIRLIIEDHWDKFVKIEGYRIRKNGFKKVEKMMGCGFLNNGYTEYMCLDCLKSKKNWIYM